MEKCSESGRMNIFSLQEILRERKRKSAIERKENDRKRERMKRKKNEKEQKEKNRSLKVNENIFLSKVNDTQKDTNLEMESIFWNEFSLSFDHQTNHKLEAEEMRI